MQVRGWVVKDDWLRCVDCEEEGEGGRRKTVGKFYLCRRESVIDASCYPCVVCE